MFSSIFLSFKKPKRKISNDLCSFVLHYLIFNAFLSCRVVLLDFSRFLEEREFLSLYGLTVICYWILYEFL